MKCLKENIGGCSLTWIGNGYDTKSTSNKKQKLIMELHQIKSNASKVRLKILQARLQQYLNHELPDVQAGFRKGRGTRDQIANIRWIMEKAREFQKKHLFLPY